LFTLTAYNQSLDSLRLVLPAGHNGKINSAEFSADSKYLVTSGVDYITPIGAIKTE